MAQSELIQEPTIALGKLSQGLLDFSGFETSFRIETTKVPSSQVQFTIWTQELGTSPEGCVFPQRDRVLRVANSV